MLTLQCLRTYAVVAILAVIPIVPLAAQSPPPTPPPSDSRSGPELNPLIGLAVFAADGSMPTLDRLLRSAAVVETVAPVGFFARRAAARITNIYG